MKTHRVGTITLGIMLICFGILFLLRIFISTLSYGFIFQLWPVIFIFLGIEILIANTQKTEKLFYDPASFILLFVLSIFAIGMAITEFVMNQASNYINYIY